MRESDENRYRLLGAVYYVRSAQRFIFNDAQAAWPTSQPPGQQACRLDGWLAGQLRVLGLGQGSGQLVGQPDGQPAGRPAGCFGQLDLINGSTVY